MAEQKEKVAPVAIDKDKDKDTENKPKRVMGPMSNDQYGKLYNTVVERYDEDTGRVRVYRGTGELIERIVTKEQHKAINYIATHHVSGA
ncbi:hypothetical protein SAMD00019534_015660 [Acytostelium subglobosum LB1]|uniref:hypothetical protein n=1 Tax=Acytostelium subglobosum LB1 TaxID=1410327 RepID=UPI000644E847|nr:hypothetical protein SAMD00019534_015660 [Acytostelium subglobosum LB1]GAM18391.1 hypothetical protein SAMD00019534_015660 [Acytostelium subglobosum LB1]|eukprot:XP_012757611.1 hypothetical protein SAMD00019534_015660 [Acytostelium subglobosum LB1]